MTYTLYDASVTVAKETLECLAAILKKGETAPNAASLPEARIHPDMLPLTFQVHFVTDLSQKMVSRLTGEEPPTLENNLKTFADFQARIKLVQGALAKADRDLVNKRGDEIVSMGLGSGKTAQLPGTAYNSGYTMPSIFFHLVTAYNILRKEGVDVGKMDYLTPYIGHHVPKEAAN
ncbi:hypothetical protein RJ55_08537 [Drechmeria coniospora]|nr:hypothetical protein RJ55_08537 [Drechmeria coniospora]